MYSILIKKIYIFLIEKQTRLFMGVSCDKSNSSSRKANEKTKTKCHNRKLCVCLCVSACVCAACAKLVDALNLSANYGQRGEMGKRGQLKRLLSCYN